MQSCAIGGDRVVCLTRWQTWITGYSGERTLERDTNDEVPEVRSNTCSQACARREELSPATGVPRARMAAREAACDSNEVSQRSPQLVIHSADNWVSFRLMCRAEQWRGLRMMPTFPLPSLKFRTAGFPQYGFKAGVSAFPFNASLAPVGLPPSFVVPAFLVGSPFCAGGRGALEHLRSSGLCRSTPGPSLRSGFFCPAPSSLIRPHPSHSQAHPDFTALRLIRQRFRRPSRGSRDMIGEMPT